MNTTTYSIAGVDVPYYANGGIDQDVLQNVIGKEARLYRKDGKTVDVKINGVDNAFLTISYTELHPSPNGDTPGRTGKCYWYRFYQRQFRSVS